MHSNTTIFMSSNDVGAVRKRRLIEMLKSAKVAFKNIFEALENSSNPFTYVYDRLPSLLTFVMYYYKETGTIKFGSF